MSLAHPFSSLMRQARLTVAILGASGYTGGELLRLLHGHQRVTVNTVTADKSVGVPVSEVFPSLDTFHTLRFEPLRIERIIKKVDFVFAALPHTTSMKPVAACVSAGKPVIDLSADYRLKRAATYEQWYGTP
ncbi:MAG: saccharopine dehydrogenase NADP-binding domain-containing protein, partial [Nitrospira sp.]|nr:saccharopine dehydrogenase NADP-binding domain-containing protein [Nitrospira sp.]